MMKRLTVVLGMAFALLLALPTNGSAAASQVPEVVVESGDLVTVVFPAGSFAVQSEVDFSAVSGDSAPDELTSSAHTALSDSLGGLAVSVRESNVSALPEELTYRGVLANGEAVNGVVSIEAPDMQNGFTAFLAQPTFVGLSMGAFLWISIAVTALIVGLFALGRSRDRGLSAPGSAPVSN